MLTQEIVRELLNYDPETGRLTWLERDRKWFKSDHDCKVWNTRLAGKEALITVGGDGYFQGKIFDKQYKSQRIIWLWLFGKWPKEIDHINHDRKDNRQLNLREVIHKDNLKNQSRAKNNISGHTGVHWCDRDKKWCAGIMVDGKPINLGYFNLLEDAVQIRKSAEMKNGFHENHGLERTER